jgi:energy-coupling factor transport system ATP-binding protein
MEPSVLILDEPTAGLDKAGSEQLLDLIRDLHGQQKVTIIFVTHQMDEVASIADRILVMDHGKIAFEGTPLELFEDRQRLTAFGLELPTITKLIDHLNEQAHPPIPTTLFQLDELAAYLEKRRRVVRNE